MQEWNRIYFFNKDVIKVVLHQILYLIVSMHFYCLVILFSLHSLFCLSGLSILVTIQIYAFVNVKLIILTKLYHKKT